ncbi:hypothetical protein LV89_04314 [Arcicella aurantiaca]|uniref:ParB-like nuclease family protein n=1 Tax=Arcicella aurantiaca TaxID=591202 RepID=A0A316DJ19_9BACT|nr:hypothetical protein [Arcicella aurantiaca]PWK17598.1 hypothetical protein LV89_04314 [Arcicella aurantiaca]
MAKMNIGAMIASKTKETFAGNKLISNENVKNNIVVIDELRDLIPPLGQDEYGQLETNILKNGCRDALSLWETSKGSITENSESPDEPIYVLIDGHNRFDICKKNNISFNVQLLNFSGLQEVKDYMIDLQLGRRNLRPEQISYFRGLRFLNEKNEKGKYDRENHKVQSEPYGQNSGIDTAEKLAGEYNVGRSTIKRDAEYAKGISKFEKTFRDEVLTGKQKVPKSLIQTIAKKETIEKPIESIEELLSMVEDSLPESIIRSVEPKVESFESDATMLMQTAKKLYKFKDRVYLDELQAIIAKMATYIS